MSISGANIGGNSINFGTGLSSGQGISGGGQPLPSTDSILLQTGAYMLLETGDFINLE